MEVGDYIKHKYHNQYSPFGPWLIDRFEVDNSLGDVIFFGDETWCELGWIQSEIEIGNAVHIPRGNGIITHKVKPHKFQ